MGIQATNIATRQLDHPQDRGRHNKPKTTPRVYRKIARSYTSHTSRTNILRLKSQVFFAITLFIIIYIRHC